ncbi:MAG: hypothetical protein IKB10_00975 [Alphaproteobacteria bacterium]|nr:hypothetical protein [Alphaproteobacteria bacterium]
MNTPKTVYDIAAQVRNQQITTAHLAQTMIHLNIIPKQLAEIIARQMV